MQRRLDSLRLKGYDYGLPGAYFITICTYGREHLFGSIRDGKMELNELGRLVDSTLTKQPEFFNGLLPDVHVVVPNHIHWVIALTGTNGVQEYKPGLRLATVPLVIQAFKSFTAVRAIKLGLLDHKKLWQDEYHDHVVRNDLSLGRIRQYIVDNPLNWDQDCENQACRQPSPFYEWLDGQGHLPPPQ